MPSPNSASSPAELADTVDASLESAHNHLTLARTYSDIYFNIPFGGEENLKAAVIDDVDRHVKAALAAVDHLIAKAASKGGK